MCHWTIDVINEYKIPLYSLYALRLSSFFTSFSIYIPLSRRLPDLLPVYALVYS